MEHNKGTKIIFSTLKWALGIYLLGFMLNMNSYMISEFSSVISQSFISSNFAQAELVEFFEFIRAPLLTLFLLFAYFSPMALLSFVLIYSFYKSKYFEGIQLKAYSYIVLVFMFSITLSAFLFG